MNAAQYKTLCNWVRRNTELNGYCDKKSGGFAGKGKRAIIRHAEEMKGGFIKVHDIAPFLSPSDLANELVCELLESGVTVDQLLDTINKMGEKYVAFWKKENIFSKYGEAAAEMKRILRNIERRKNFFNKNK